MYMYIYKIWIMSSETRCDMGLSDLIDSARKIKAHVRSRLFQYI